MLLQKSVSGRALQLNAVKRTKPSAAKITHALGTHTSAKLTERTRQREQLLRRRAVKTKPTAVLLLQRVPVNKRGSSSKRVQNVPQTLPRAHTRRAVKRTITSAAKISHALGTHILVQLTERIRRREQLLRQRAVKTKSSAVFILQRVPVNKKGSSQKRVQNVPQTLPRAHTRRAVKRTITSAAKISHALGTHILVQLTERIRRKEQMLPQRAVKTRPTAGRSPDVLRLMVYH